MYRQLTSFLLILIAICLSSCNKEDEGGHHGMCEGDQVYKPITQQMIAAKYKTGTYWIFIDSISGSFDSTYVNSTSENDLHDGCLTTYHAYSYKLQSVPAGEAYSYTIVTGGLYKDANGTNTGTLIYSQYNFTTSFESILFLDSLFIYDRYYTNLTKTTVFKDKTHNNSKVVYYINSEFGFLRKDIFDANDDLISKRLLVRKNIVR